MAQSKDDYGQTLAILRQQAEAAPDGPIPFWNFFNASKHTQAAPITIFIPRDAAERLLLFSVP